MSARDIIILGSSSQQPTRQRNHGAYFVRWNDEGLLFDPGEGTQRQFIFADIAPTSINRIFVSHFHGDHCLGLGSILMRLNLDKVTHPIHCYYPASGKKYFDRLRYGTIYHEMIEVIEHPVSKEGFVEETDNFIIECAYMDHRVDNLAWRISEKDERKFSNEKLRARGVFGPLVKELEQKGELILHGEKVSLDDVSWIRPGDVFSIIMDTRENENCVKIAKDATVLICESTYLDEHEDLAKKHYHLTAAQAALIAKKAGAKALILTHFSARYTNLKGFEQEARAIFPNTYIAEDLRRFPFPKS